jgi:hypothetical protein
MAGKIKFLWKLGHLQHNIAARFGINQGRVSEVVNGKSHPGVPPDGTPPVDPQPKLPF